MKVAEHPVAQHQTEGIRQVHPCLRLHTLTLDIDNVSIKEHPCEVQGIDAKVKERTTTEIRTHDAWLVAHRIAEGSSDEARFTNPSAANEVANHLDHWLITRPDGLSQKDLLFMCKIEDFLGLPCICHKGFLHQTRLTGQQCLTRHIKMMRVGRANVNEVNVRIGNKTGIGAVCLCNVPLGSKGICRFLKARADGIGLALCKASQRDDSLLGNPSGTNNTDAQNTVFLHFSRKDTTIF